ncbi:hypothetical protein MMC17_001075 [Xylographa soralifera]|nr:hypothetical protein [Xylographa soralifera]
MTDFVNRAFGRGHYENDKHAVYDTTEQVSQVNKHVVLDVTKQVPQVNKHIVQDVTKPVPQVNKHAVQDVTKQVPQVNKHVVQDVTKQVPQVNKHVVQDITEQVPQVQQWNQGPRANSSQVVRAVNIHDLPINQRPVIVTKTKLFSDVARIIPVTPLLPLHSTKSLSQLVKLTAKPAHKQSTTTNLAKFGLKIAPQETFCQILLHLGYEARKCLAVTCNAMFQRIRDMTGRLIVGVDHEIQEQYLEAPGSGNKRVLKVRTAAPASISQKLIVERLDTRTGKTFAYIAPIVSLLLHRKTMRESKPYVPSKNIYGDEMNFVLTLVILPTREAAIQVFRNFLRFTNHTSLSTALVIGGTDYETQKLETKKGCDILVATPGRLKELMSSNRWLPEFPLTRILDVLLLGVNPDGAGYDMNDIYMKPFLTRFLFCASRSDEVERFAAANLFPSKGYTSVRLSGYLAEACDMQYHVVLRNDFDPEQQLFEILLRSWGQTLVFCNYQESADHLKDYRLSKGLHLVASCHAGYPQHLREEIFGEFHTEKVHLLFTTDIAAPALEFEHLMRVIHYHLPKSIGDYLDRCGHAGHMGRIGSSVGLFSKDNDASFQNELAASLESMNQDVPAFWYHPQTIDDEVDSDTNSTEVNHVTLGGASAEAQQQMSWRSYKCSGARSERGGIIRAVYC